MEGCVADLSSLGLQKSDFSEAALAFSSCIFFLHFWHFSQVSILSMESEYGNLIYIHTSVLRGEQQQQQRVERILAVSVPVLISASLWSVSSLFFTCTRHNLEL